MTPTTSGTYTLDRWRANISVSSKFSVQQSTVAPANYTNSILITSLAATTVSASDQYFIGTRLEGYDIAHLNFGSADAQTITLSFWVRSSLTGTFGAGIFNSAANRCFPISYTISSANTWEQKTVTIAGDTSGTWLTDNGVGLQLIFSLGIGSTFQGTAGAWTSSTHLTASSTVNLIETNGATLYITGVQLEVGTVATPFEHRSYGEELALCQRYFQRVGSTSGDTMPPIYATRNTTNQALLGYTAVQCFRATPSITMSGSFTLYGEGSGESLGAIAVVVGNQRENRQAVWTQTASGIISGASKVCYGSSGAYFDFDSEL